MDQDQTRNLIFEKADKFISLANELTLEDNSGTVGTALRYAAARYSAFEASIQAGDLEQEREDQLKVFSDEFARMLRINIDEYIQVQKSQKPV
ncbi:MAG: DUF3144 domain-containing protein [Desulfuromonas sp.]|nr:MAG: DUF3144 domain-containing protein [Desulfuromonas sp.]